MTGVDGSADETPRIRRRLVLGAAWSVPAAASVTTAPAVAASAMPDLTVVVPEPTTRPTGADLGDVELRLSTGGLPVADEVLAVVDGTGPTFADGVTTRVLRTDASGVAHCSGLTAGPVPGVFAVLGEHAASGASGRALVTVVEPRARPFVLGAADGTYLAVGPDGGIVLRGTAAEAAAAAMPVRFPFDPGPVAASAGTIADDAGRCLTGTPSATPWGTPVVDVRAATGGAEQTWHVDADGRAWAGDPSRQDGFLADTGTARLTLVRSDAVGLLRIVLV